MGLYSGPPALGTFAQDKPTLLVCWWITIFCATIILLRIAGRYVRTERLFREDKIAALAVIPLFLRMGCVHVVLVYGTNNAQFEGVPLSAEELRMKSIASGVVLLARILYALTLWILKEAILEFFKRLTGGSWERRYDITLNIIRGMLAATFVAVLITDLAECRPIHHYWQVLPDPGPQCRQAYAQLITMAACNVITDLLLVFFPIPIILRSHMSKKKKIQLVALFSLSLVVVAVTLYRVPHIIDRQGRQQSRSLMASVELLAATTAANALVLGSFVRDRGIKKRKFKYGSSTADSMDRTSSAGTRRPTLNRQWGSDEDLVRDLGIAVHPDLRESPTSERGYFHPAPMAKLPENLNSWQFPHDRKTGATRSDDSLQVPPYQAHEGRRESLVTPTRKVSFFDVGGLLGDETDTSLSREEADVARSQSVPNAAVPAGISGLRRGSTALLQDLGGLLSSPLNVVGTSRSQSRTRSESRGGGLARSESKSNRGGTELQPISARGEGSDEYPKPESRQNPNNNMELMDPGGLLGPASPPPANSSRE